MFTWLHLLSFPSCVETNGINLQSNSKEYLLHFFFFSRVGQLFPGDFPFSEDLAGPQQAAPDGSVVRRYPRGGGDGVPLSQERARRLQSLLHGYVYW